LRQFGVRVKFRDLLDAIPTVTALAAHLDQHMAPEPEKVAAPPPALPALLPELPQLPNIAELSGASSEFVQQVIAQQLGLMAQQLAVLRGVGAAVPSPAGSAQDASTSAGPRVATRFGPYIPPDKRSQTLTERQQRRLNDLLKRYNDRTRGSKNLTQQYRETFADARAVTGFRSQWKEMIY
jgi:hypothetical protein